MFVDDSTPEEDSRHGIGQAIIDAKVTIQLNHVDSVIIHQCGIFNRSIYYTFIKSPPTMWWWRLIVFDESARRRRHRILFLLSLENPCSDYFEILAVCILALGNLPDKFLPWPRAEMLLV